MDNRKWKLIGNIIKNNSPMENAVLLYCVSVSDFVASR